MTVVAVEAGIPPDEVRSMAWRDIEMMAEYAIHRIRV